MEKNSGRLENTIRAFYILTKISDLIWQFFTSIFLVSELGYKVPSKNLNQLNFICFNKSRKRLSLRTGSSRGSDFICK